MILVADALGEVYKACYEENWSGALVKVDWLQRVDPEYSFARRLRRQIEKWNGAPVNRTELVAVLQSWSSATDRVSFSIPEEETFRSPEPWVLEGLRASLDAPSLLKHQPRSTTLNSRDYEDYAYDAFLYREIASRRVALSGETLAYFVDAVREESGLNIHLTEGACRVLEGNPDCRTSMKGATLEEAFNVVLPMFRLKAWVKCGVVLIGVD